MERRPTSKLRTMDPAIEPRRNRRDDEAATSANKMDKHGRTTEQRGRDERPTGGRASKQCIPHDNKGRAYKVSAPSSIQPSKSNVEKAIENGHFTTWPGLTPEAVEKYLPRHSPATDKGHMSQQPQGVRSTSKSHE